MNYSIRELKQDGNKVLDTFLYEAIFYSRRSFCTAQRYY